MAFRGDERAVTVQIGAVLLLGFIVIAMSTYQITVVPTQNEGVEYRHSQGVQRDMIQVRGAIQSGTTGGGIAPQSVTLGSQYPPRTLFINPPSPSGTLRNESLGDLTVANARAVGNAETRDYWDGGTDRTFETDRLAYEPNYNVYQNAPETVVGATVAYNRFDSGTTLALSEQSVVDGRTLSFVALEGNYQRSQSGTVSVDPEAVSRTTRTVSVTDDGSNPVVLTVPTTLSAGTWQDLLSGEIDGSNSDPDRYVNEVRPGSDPDTIEIEMETGATYNLRLAKVGVGTGYDDPGAAYITDVQSPEPSVTNNSTHRFVVEVRDRFNNPVSGEDVVGSTTNANDTLAPSTQTTDEQGRAAFTYTAPGEDAVGETVGVDFEIGGNATNYEHVHYGIRIRGAGGAGSGGDGSGSGTTDEVNPGAPGTVILDTATPIKKTTNLTVTLKNNTNANSVVSIQRARISFFFQGTTGSSRGKINKAWISHATTSQTPLSVGGDFVNLSSDPPTNNGGTIPLNPRPGQSSDLTTINLDFDREVYDDDFYVLSIRLTDGNTYTYFISHP